MPRTTVDLDVSVLNELKNLSKAQRKSLGQVISKLVAVALGQREPPASRPKLVWRSQPMHALIDLEDKEAVGALFDRYP